MEEKVECKHLDPSIVDAMNKQEGKRIDMTKLEKGDKVIFKTKNSTYEATIENPKNGEVWLKGGERFPFPWKVFINGSTFGGSIIQPGFICEGMNVEIGRKERPFEPLTTTKVQSVEVIKNEQNK